MSKQYTITIEYGSDWQKELDALGPMLKAYKEHMEARHKKNKVSISISDS